MRFPFAAQPPLPLKAQPFEQRHRSAIVGVGIGIDAPKAAPGEGDIDDGGDRFARDPAAPVAATQAIDEPGHDGPPLDQGPPAESAVVARLGPRPAPMPLTRTGRATHTAPPTPGPEE